MWSLLFWSCWISFAEGVYVNTLILGLEDHDNSVPGLDSILDYYYVKVCCPGSAEYICSNVEYGIKFRRQDKCEVLNAHLKKMETPVVYHLFLSYHLFVVVVFFN